MTTHSSLARVEVSAVNPSLDVFSRASRVLPTDPKVIERIAEIQELVGGELDWIERTLEETCLNGTCPAGQAAEHLVLRGGKRVRPLTALLAAACFGTVSAQARTVALVAELVHSATLLHDDVADEGTERRGVRTSRMIYGNAISVLAGDLLLVHALERTQREVPDALPELLQTLHMLVDGEIVQLRGRCDLDVTEATYERILRGKTASLFAWAARAGARSAEASEGDVARLATFGEQLGIAFQLVDDALDYTGAATGKSTLADLREGKMTLPLVLAVRAQPELIHLVRQIHAGDLEPVASLSRMVLASGTCELVRVRAAKVTEQAVSTLQPIAASPAKDLLVAVARELTARVA